jgi:hypothetical protein
VSPSSGRLHFAFKGDLHFFPWLDANPPNLSRFASFISAYRADHSDWGDVYPVTERLVHGFGRESSGVFLVDVGRGRGHDIDQFCARHTSLPGKVIVQDQASVTASLDHTGRARPYVAEAHDFFTPQPVKHARAYSSHLVLDDWNDDDSLQILKNLIPTLKQGDSWVLLNEIVVSEDQPSLAAMSMDVQMLAQVGVRERTEKEMRMLLPRAGLEVLGIHSSPGVAESLIETELV